MVASKREKFRSSLLDWASKNIREFPWRECNRSLYDVFVAEFFLTQTPAENVSTVYPRFLEQFPTLEAIDDASEDELVNVIEPLGFYNMRAEALKKIAADHKSLPETAEGLIDLPRVGRYVANATVCFARGQSIPILDRNVKRIYRRVFGESWPENPAEQLRFAEGLLPEENARTYNLALLDFGAAICQPKPRCDECFATDDCHYYRQNVT